MVHADLLIHIWKIVFKLKNCRCILDNLVKAYIYREREFGSGATRSTDGLCITDRFFVFKIQMVDLIGQNIFV
jgi:hypothetical protein